MNISRVAKLAGVNVEIIRYYQRRGLIVEPAKPFGSYRRYPAEIVSRIRFIKRAQLLGFSLREIAILLRPASSGDCSWVHDLVKAKIRSLRSQAASLTQSVQALECLLERCPGGAGCEGCVDCVDCPLRGRLAETDICLRDALHPKAGVRTPVKTIMTQSAIASCGDVDH